MQSLESIPTWFADLTDINLAAAQVLLSTVVIVMILLPVMYSTRKSGSRLFETVLLFLVQGFLVGIGWLPSWIMIGTLAVSCLAIAVLGSEIVTGRSS